MITALVDLWFDSNYKYTRKILQGDHKMNFYRATTAIQLLVKAYKAIITWH